MAMPIDLVLVRHGHSEGNAVHGNEKLFTPEFAARLSHTWRLTDQGIEQATKAGEWLTNNGHSEFDYYGVSEYDRALETAMYLNLPKAQWIPSFLLREREWGDMDVMTQSERMRRFPESLEAKRKNSFGWRPPNGESMGDCCNRVDRVIATLHRKCSNGRALLVTHGEVMWAMRVRLEKINLRRYLEMDRNPDPMLRINNGQILHYTRVDPMTNKRVPHFGWMRSICPWDTSRSSNEWMPIERHSLSNEDLAEYLKKTHL